MKRVDYKLGTSLDKNYVIQNPVFPVNNIQIINDTIIGNLIVNREETILGYAYDKKEILFESHKFGKKLFEILKNNFKDFKLQISTNNVLDIQKKKILEEFKIWIENYGFISISKIIDDYKIILDYDEIIDLSRKYIYLYLIFEYLQIYSGLATNNIKDYNKPIQKLNNINKLLDMNYSINSEDYKKLLYGLNFMFVPIIIDKANYFSLFFDIQLKPYSIFSEATNEIVTLYSSENLFDLTWTILLESISLIYTLGDTIELLNRLITCPICGLLKEKTGKKDIICESCRHTPEGRNYIKQRNINNNKERVHEIYMLVDTKKALLTIDIQNEVNILKEDIDKKRNYRPLSKSKRFRKIKRKII